MSNIPTEQELMALCQNAARQAISDTIRQHVPAWNPADLATLADCQDKALVASTLWLANCFEAMGVTHAARYVYGYATERTLNRIERTLQLYPRPHVNRWRAGAFYVLRSDVYRLSDTIQDKTPAYPLTDIAAR